MGQIDPLLLIKAYRALAYRDPKRRDIAWLATAIPAVRRWATAYGQAEERLEDVLLAAAEGAVEEDPRSRALAERLRRAMRAGHKVQVVVQGGSGSRDEAAVTPEQMGSVFLLLHCFEPRASFSQLAATLDWNPQDSWTKRLAWAAVEDSVLPRLQELLKTEPYRQHVRKKRLRFSADDVEVLNEVEVAVFDMDLVARTGFSHRILEVEGQRQVSLCSGSACLHRQCVALDVPDNRFSASTKLIHADSPFGRVWTIQVGFDFGAGPKLASGAVIRYRYVVRNPKVFLRGGRRTVALTAIHGPIDRASLMVCWDGSYRMKSRPQFGIAADTDWHYFNTARTEVPSLARPKEDGEPDCQVAEVSGLVGTLGATWDGGARHGQKSWPDGSNIR